MDVSDTGNDIAAEIFVENIYGYDNGHTLGIAINLAYANKAKTDIFGDNIPASAGVGNEYMLDLAYKAIIQTIRPIVTNGDIILTAPNAVIPNNLNRDINNMVTTSGTEINPIHAYDAQFLDGKSFPERTLKHISHVLKINPENTPETTNLCDDSNKDSCDINSQSQNSDNLIKDFAQNLIKHIVDSTNNILTSLKIIVSKVNGKQNTVDKEKENEKKENEENEDEDEEASLENKEKDEETSKSKKTAKKPNKEKQKTTKKKQKPNIKDKSLDASIDEFIDASIDEFIDESMIRIYQEISQKVTNPEKQLAVLVVAQSLIDKGFYETTALDAAMAGLRKAEESGVIADSRKVEGSSVMSLVQEANAAVLVVVGTVIAVRIIASKCAQNPACRAAVQKYTKDIIAYSYDVIKNLYWFNKVDNSADSKNVSKIKTKSEKDAEKDVEKDVENLKNNFNLDDHEGGDHKGHIKERHVAKTRA